MGPADQRVDINTSAAVRCASGFFFGTARWIHGDRVMVELDSELVVGDDLDLRLTLVPTSGTALAKAVVHRVLVTAKDEPNRYVLQVRDVAPEDKARFSAW